MAKVTGISNVGIFVKDQKRAKQFYTKKLGLKHIGGMPEFVRHGRTGFVFDDVSELSGYLRALASDPGLADRMGKEARRVVERL